MYHFLEKAPQKKGKRKMLFWVLIISSICTISTGTKTVHVGVILDFDSPVGRIGRTSLSLALDDFYADSNSTKLELHPMDSQGHVVDAAANALSLLKDVKVDAIIGPQKSAQASFVIDLGDGAKVPIICFSATSPSLRGRSPYFVRTTPSDATQASPIAAVVRYFDWNQVVLVYEDSDYGNGIVSYLANAFQDVNVRVSYRSVIPLSATDHLLLQELYKMKTMQTRVFVVHVSSSLASKLFIKAKEAGMMIEGYAWIVTTGLMDLFYLLDSRVKDSMQGVLGVKPSIPKSKQLGSVAKRWKRRFLEDNPNFSHVQLGSFGIWAYDTLWALAMAAERAGFSEPSSLHGANPFEIKISERGPKILEALSKVKFRGLGGNFHLVEGELEPPTFEILNVDGQTEIAVGLWTNSQGIQDLGKEISNGSSYTGMERVIFPGNSRRVPKGWDIPVSGKKLRVGVPAESGFKEFIEVKRSSETKAWKVSGCYIDIFNAVMATLSYAVAYEFVPFENPDGSNAGGYYDKLVNRVLVGDIDAVVGDVTITSNRSKEVDFTLPFAAGGVTITVKTKRDRPNNKTIFLKPLTKELWLTAIALFIFTGLAIWVLEHRYSSAYRGPPAQHTGMIFFFPFMSLVFAHREKIVTNLARFVVVVWVFVVLVLSSTFTASLSARLTVQRLLPDSTDVKQLLENGDYVGCRSGSFIHNLLQEMGFSPSKIRTCKSPELCHEALSKGGNHGGIAALFTVRPYTSLFLSKYGDTYREVGEICRTEGFAFVFPKHSPLVSDVSRGIVQLMETGMISNIERQWMARNKAYIDLDDSTNLTTITLESFKVIFLITVGITTCCLIVFLMSYVYKNRVFIRNVLNSDGTVVSKLVKICKHFDQRDKSFGLGEDETASAHSRRSNAVVPVPSPAHTNDAQRLAS